VKKKLLAAAVVSAFAAPAAFAQTAPTNVTIYGGLVSEVISVKGDDAPGGDYQRRTRVGSPGGTLIGFRGSETLGGGMRVIWQVEQNVGSGDGTGTTNSWGSRNTFLGLQSGIGQVFVGNFDSPLKLVLGINNTMRFGLTGPNGMNPIMNNGDATGDDAANSSAFSRRVNNSVNYASPMFSGFQVRAQYMANENKSLTSGVNPQLSPSLWGVSATWAGGPFRAGVGYQKHTDFRTAGAFPTSRGVDDSSYLISGSWNSGPFLVQAAYSRLSYGTVGGDLKRNNWLVGGQYSMGMHRFRAQYQHAGDGSGAPANTIIGNVVQGGDTGAQMWQLGYGYALSKRTEVYGFYSMMDNDRNGIVNHSGGHASIPAGAFRAGMDITIFGIGMAHSF